MGRRYVGAKAFSRKAFGSGGRNLERLRFEGKAGYSELLIATYVSLMQILDAGAVPDHVARDAIGMCESEVYDRLARNSISWAQGNDPERAQIFIPAIGADPPIDDAMRMQATNAARKAYLASTAPQAN